MSGPQENLQFSVPASTPQPQQRLPSGIKGLDKILKGGFIKGDSYIVIGAPGTGKTILSNQIAFHHIAGGGRVVFLTVLTEAHDRMIAHMRPLSFFNLEAINTNLFYISGYGVLKKEGLNGLQALIKDVIRQHKATLFILDGLSTAEDFAASGLDFKTFIKSVDAFSGINGCTIVMLTHRSAGALLQPEYTMVDGVIELFNVLNNVRPNRQISIPKFRGSAFLEGIHTFEITSDGIVVHPRLEALLAKTTYSNYEKERLPFGISRLDKMLQGGLVKGTATMLLGPTGSGKTLLGLNFLAAGLARGEPCVHFGFYETPHDLIEKAEGIGLSLREHWQSGLLQIMWQPPLEWDVDGLMAQLLLVVEQRQVKRVFIDALGAFQQSLINSDRILRFWSALANELRAQGVTFVYSQEMSSIYGGSVDLTLPGMSAVTENVILLRLSELNGETNRLLSIVKLRDSIYDRTVRQFTVSDKGIDLGERFSSSESTLTSVSGGQLSLSHNSSSKRSKPGIINKLLGKLMRTKDKGYQTSSKRNTK